MKKIKVLYLITKADVGGAQKYVTDLAQSLPRDRFEAKIVYGGKDLRWLSNATRPWFLFANDWLAVAEIVRLLKREQPDVLHLNSSKAGVLGAIAARIYKVKSRKSKVESHPIKVVFTAHGWVFNPTNAIAGPIRWFYIALHMLTAKFQDAIICVSEYDAALARQLHITPDHKITMIHNGIDPSLKFLSKEKAREEILSKSKVPPGARLAEGGERQMSNVGEVWIGSIGRIVKEKNYETLIRAAALVPRGVFFIIGDGPELPKLKVESQKSNVSDRFFFIPPSGDDARYLKAFDMFVMSSIKEGLPYILLEAMAAELPIIVTEAGGIPEIIKSHENGIMITQRDPAQLAHAITGLLANPSIAREIEKTAHAAVRKSFNLTTMVKKTEEVYEKIVRSK
ncbi:glycosyltransferase [Patescibacteria group bacterium]|nr:glycosyltransferase [Patescibacteria group bacterium]